MAQLSKAWTALAENLATVPSSHVSWHTTTCNSSSGGSSASDMNFLVFHAQSTVYTVPPVTSVLWVHPSELFSTVVFHPPSPRTATPLYVSSSSPSHVLIFLATAPFSSEHQHSMYVSRKILSSLPLSNFCSHHPNQHSHLELERRKKKNPATSQSWPGITLGFSYSELASPQVWINLSQKPCTHK